MVFGERGPNELTNVSQLPDYAEDAGVERAAYEECVKENRHMDKVDADASDAVAIGARGTPYSVILMGDQKMVINGAENYDRMKILIDGLVK